MFAVDADSAIDVFTAALSPAQIAVALCTHFDDESTCQESIAFEYWQNRSTVFLHTECSVAYFEFT